MSNITPEEIKSLRRPFPLDKHTLREGHKEGGKIRWFVYIERSAVQDLLDELFSGEWETSEPKMYPVETRTIKDDGSIETSHEMSATMGIIIRGLTRWDGGESDDGSTKSAITNAFRRTAAYGWGIARYLYDMDIRIKTDTYSSKDNYGKWQTDWKKYDQVKKEAWDMFTQWYNRQFGPSVVDKTPPQSHQDGATAILQPAVGDFEPTSQNGAKTGAERLGTPNGQRIGQDIAKGVEVIAVRATVKNTKNNKPFLLLESDSGQKVSLFSRDPLRAAGYECEDWTEMDKTYVIDPPAAVTTKQDGKFLNFESLIKADSQVIPF